ncbi:hypothetical protein N7466_005847 [Penicillium verhagenii]|uniref:uncharacterized protein n=1 Tax=Penicillium verhagenii TaxID=1562060 RepID=UPI002545834D|nr:uncharacterized protein N7466_005847 [Penicillium verhagenii]KAJ5930354.1 hypothetical protein N7466_005847 [Penicillium verhagenii]
MAEDEDIGLITAALHHHQEGLNLFIRHLATPDAYSWVTFPSLWLFILYEQMYGKDPKVMQAHLRGVRDVIASHGRSVIAFSTERNPDSLSDEPKDRYRVPPQIINQITLWTIHQDAKASTFGLGGSMIDLLNEEYPDLIQQISEDSSNALRDAWGLMYPAAEELWDIQAGEMSKLVHETTMLRYKLTKIENGDSTQNPRNMIQLGRELKLLEKKFSPFIKTVFSPRKERNSMVSNMCVIVAEFLALVVLHDRLAYDIQSSRLSNLLQACAILYECEGPNFLRHVAWAMFVAGFETDDIIHESWIIDRFAQLQRSGNNIRRAMTLLQTVFLEKRTSIRHISYSEWLQDDRFEKFTI